MTSSSAQSSRPPKIDQTAFQASTGVLLGIAVVVAVGRIVARFHISRKIAIDDAFFYLAVATFISGTTLLYFDIPYIYLEQDVGAGLRPAPANLVAQLIHGSKLQAAAATLCITTVVCVKYSFLFFFRGLIRHQKHLTIWWWLIVIILIPIGLFLMASDFIDCPYFDERLFVECAKPAASSRGNSIIRATGLLDIITDGLVVSVPVILLWDVKMSLRRKFALWGILCLGVFTLIAAVIRIAGDDVDHGRVDIAWTLFWLQVEAALAVIVVSMSAFRALFVAHRASKSQESPQQGGFTSRWIWSKRLRSTNDLPSSPRPTFTGVRTYIRQSPHRVGSYEGERDDMEFPLQGRGILVTQNISSEKTEIRPFPETFV